MASFADRTNPPDGIVGKDPQARIPEESADRGYGVVATQRHPDRGDIYTRMTANRSGPPGRAVPPNARMR